MGAKLHIQPEVGAPFEVPVFGTVTIGRTRENAVWLRTNAQVSRQHAVIRCYGGDQYQLIDLGSVNGVKIDDQRVVVPTMLKNGSRITIAHDVLTFQITTDTEVDDQNFQTVAATTEVPAITDTPVALLVADIREFGARVETLPSEAVAPVLGKWLRDEAKVVERVGGTLDKFIGDAMLAYWGSTSNAKLNCGAAFAAARQILELAGGRVWPDGVPLRVVIAVHYGPVSCSNVGLAAERDTTVIGDAVNTVFRMTSAAKELDEPLLVSSDVLANLPGAHHFRDLGEQALKGKSHPVRVFGLEA